MAIALSTARTPPVYFGYATGVYNQLVAAKIPISQDVANQINGFSNQRFRYAVVEWLVANNHAISELETPAF